MKINKKKRKRKLSVKLLLRINNINKMILIVHTRRKINKKMIMLKKILKLKNLKTKKSIS